MVSLICCTHKSNIRSERGVCIIRHLLASKKLHVNHSPHPSSLPPYPQDAGTKQTQSGHRAHRCSGYITLKSIASKTAQLILNLLWSRIKFHTILFCPTRLHITVSRKCPTAVACMQVGFPKTFVGRAKSTCSSCSLSVLTYPYPTNNNTNLSYFRTVI